MMRQPWATGIAVGLLGLLLPVQARADAYYVLVFGGQRAYVNSPIKTHSWATFIHHTSEGRVQYFTISWLAASGNLKLLKPAEQGRNYTLEETLAYCRENRMEIAIWGPYQIKADLFDRAILQKARLDKGEALYKMFDSGSPTGEVSNCVHALDFMAREPGQKEPSVRVLPGAWGESGSYWVALTEGSI